MDDDCLTDIPQMSDLLGVVRLYRRHRRSVTIKVSLPPEGVAGGKRSFGGRVITLITSDSSSSAAPICTPVRRKGRDREMSEVRDRTEDVEAIGGEVLVSQGHTVRVFPRNRMCAMNECRTRLSIYNETQYCSVHGSELPARGAGRRRKG